MTEKTAYEELEKRIKELNKAEFEHNLIEENLRKRVEKYRLIMIPYIP